MVDSRADVSIYKNLEIESKVAEASPHQLIQLLFDEAHLSLTRAKTLHESEREASDAQVQKAIDIISYLLQSLSQDVESDLPHNLTLLYEYMIRQLLTYRIRRSPEALDEIDSLLETISSGWRDIG